jgi:hypothetical protein
LSGEGERCDSTWDSSFGGFVQWQGVGVVLDRDGIEFGCGGRRDEWRSVRFIFYFLFFIFYFILFYFLIFLNTKTRTTYAMQITLRLKTK